MARNVSRLVLILLVAGTGVVPAFPQDAFRANVVVMTGSKRHGPPIDKVADALRRCAVELGVSERRMPSIILLVAGKDEARVADVQDWGHVFVENHAASGKTVYMAWMVNGATDADLLQMFTAILNDEFSLGVTAEDAKALSRRLALRSMTTASVDSLLSREK